MPLIVGRMELQGHIKITKPSELKQHSFFDGAYNTYAQRYYKEIGVDGKLGKLSPDQIIVVEGVKDLIIESAHKTFIKDPYRVTMEEYKDIEPIPFDRRVIDLELPFPKAIQLYFKKVTNKGKSEDIGFTIVSAFTFMQYELGRKGLIEPLRKGYTKEETFASFHEKWIQNEFNTAKTSDVFKAMVLAYFKMDLNTLQKTYLKKMENFDLNASTAGQLTIPKDFYERIIMHRYIDIKNDFIKEGTDLKQQF